MGHSIGKLFRPIEEAMRDRCDVESLYLPAKGYGLWSLWRNIHCVVSRLNRERFDIIHITGTENYLLPILKDYPTVLTLHDLASLTNNCSGLRLALKSRLFVETIKEATHVCFISAKSMEETLTAINLERSKVSVIHNAVDPNYRFKAKIFNTQRPQILHIGTTPNKNLTRTIAAIEGMSCTLRIVGSLTDTQILELETAQIDYTNVCAIDDDAMIKEYEMCDIVNFPSTYEGFGMPIIEGQAVGRVVITSAIEPMNRVSGGGAYLVDPLNVESIKEGYRLLIDDPTMREEMIKRGVENVKKYGVEEVASSYFELYTEINKKRIQI